MLAYRRMGSATLTAFPGLASPLDVAACKVVVFVGQGGVSGLEARLHPGSRRWEVRGSPPGSLAGYPNLVSAEISPAGIDKREGLRRVAHAPGGGGPPECDPLAMGASLGCGSIAGETLRG